MARKRRFIYASRKANSRRSIARGTAAAIILVAVIYFAVAGGLGTWLADKLIVPFMNGGNATLPPDENPAALPSASAASPPAATASPAPTPTVTGELTLTPLPFYSIQLGAFANQANAETEARSIRERGAAGYVYQDEGEGRYRVLASAYLSRADADKVSRQLLEQQGLESYVYELYTEGGAVTLRVTASSERVDGMRDALDAWRLSLDEIEDISRRLDLLEIGPELARSECRAAAERLIENREALTGGATLEGERETISSLGGMMDAQAAALLNISDNTAMDAMEISAQIKYTYIDSLNRYGKLLRSIAQA